MTEWTEADEKELATVAVFRDLYKALAQAGSVGAVVSLPLAATLRTETFGLVQFLSIGILFLALTGACLIWLARYSKLYGALTFRKES